MRIDGCVAVSATKADDNKPILNKEKTQLMKHFYFFRTIQIIAVAAIMSAFGAARLQAFDVTTYASSSVLSKGKWVKVGVKNTGMHHIPAATLRSWGFTSPERVRVYGYGGGRISDVLSAANYVDDLPMVQSVNTSAGVYFYGVGPISWTLYNRTNFYHVRNPFTETGYYYLTESDEPLREIEENDMSYTPDEDSDPSTFRSPLMHEVDLEAYHESGHDLYGESFLTNPTQTFDFDLPWREDLTNVWVRTRFVTDGFTDVTLTASANGNRVPGSYVVRGKTDPNDQHIWGVVRQFDCNITPEGEKLAWTISRTTPSGLRHANLDYIDVTYTRLLHLDGPSLTFGYNAVGTYTLTGATAATHLWDVTAPLNIAAIGAESSDAGLTWRQSTSTRREYVAWNESSSLPAPEYIGTVDNQDLHAAIVDEKPDMIVFTSGNLATEAERVANLHRYGPDTLKVMVVDQRLVFNEFSSGSPDVGAFRRMLKMAYDLGRQEGGNPLRYALMFGPATFDNRRLTTEGKTMSENVLATWQSDNSLSDGASYTTDDFLAMLSDGSGSSSALGRATLDIAVGRIPARTQADAKAYVDKLVKYVEKSRPGLWRNIVTAVADNGNTGVHMTQTESMINNMMSTPGGSAKVYNKVYIDAYNIVSGVASGARDRMYRQFDEGTLLWTYVGHGSLTSLTSEGMVRTEDLDKKFYLRNLPMLYAATCDFLKWDGTEKSGAERLFFHPTGGVISAVSATRTAAINANEYMSDAFGSKIFDADASGRPLTIGESYRLAKNMLASRSDVNRMRYVLLGSPAMRLVSPQNAIVLETINDEEVGDENQVTVKARQRVTFSGIVTDLAGNKLSDFNGPLWMSIYDAASSVTSNGLPADGTSGKQITFDDQTSMLAQARDSVRNGEFSVTVAMPSEVSQNFRPALASFFAQTVGQDADASGVSRDFYVYGVDEGAERDTIPPTVDYAYLNHESFQPGSVVNEQPVFIASVSDNVGINLSLAGIGHQMTLTIDGRTTLSDVALYYTPFSDGRTGGTINYPLPTLSDGNHTVTLRVWDTSGNATYETVEFYVQQGARPEIFDIYSDANPASVEANFYLQHNRPDAVVTVTFEVYDMAGRRMWTSTVTDRSDMFVSAPVKWNLCSMAGTRVIRGIYIYRAIVKTEQGEVTSRAKRIAVAGH